MTEDGKRKTEDCGVCNGTGLAYDRTEYRMVPCGGICCVVKELDKQRTDDVR
jgi:hypothetical protein